MTPDGEFSRSMSVNRAKAILVIGPSDKSAFMDPEDGLHKCWCVDIFGFLNGWKENARCGVEVCAPENAVRRTCDPNADANRQILIRRKRQVAVKEKIRVRLKSYDHTLIDAAAEKIVEVAKRNGATVSGPIPLPTEKEIVTILRAVHKYKDSREQFEMRTHKRLIDIVKPSQKVVDALMSVELPAGVEIEVKI